MPAIITHHLFGEDASRKLPGSLHFADEELLAFLLGNQGPDPLFFCFTAGLQTIQGCHELARSIHRSREVDLLMAVRDAVSHLRSDVQGIGRAFALGLLAHYLLDSEAHAFIYAQENALCEANPELADAHGQVHALIESDLDTWMLWNARKQTIKDVPAYDYLSRTKRISLVGGTILSQVAWQVFGIKLGSDSYEGSIRDYELLYRTIDPVGNPRSRVLSGVERIGLRSSYLDALAHTDSPTEDCAAANLTCDPWTDPLTGKRRHASFPDVFYDALSMWPALAEAFVKSDRAALETLMQRGYDGGALRG